MKHRHITYATRYTPGYFVPKAPPSRKGAKFPGAQKFKKPGESKK